MSEIDWSLVWTEATKYAVGAAFTLAITGLVWLKNRAKRLYFNPESWKLASRREKRGLEDAEFFDLKGTIKFFSKKTSVIALHRPAIELTKGRWPRREVVRRLEDLTFGEGHESGNVGYFSMRLYDKLKEIEMKWTPKTGRPDKV